LSKLAAGASATVTVVDPDGDTVTPTVAKTITGVAATELANAISISKTTAAVKVGYDGDATYGETTDDVPDTTISGVDYIATAQNLGSEFQFGGGLKNAYGTALTTDTVIVATVTEGNYINCDSDTTNDGTISAGTASVMVLSITDNSGLFECRVVAVDGAEGLGGAVTATIKTVGGTVIKEISAAFLGEIASLANGSAGAVTVTQLLASINLGTAAGDIPTSISATSVSLNIDNARYNGVFDFNDLPAFVLAADNPANWQTNDTTAFTLVNNSLFPV
jgi:hypothetical protein